MIIVIICTLLRSYPPDSSPLRNSPVILPAWLPPFSLSLSLFLFIPLAQHPRSRAILRNASQLSPVLPFSSRGSLSLSHRRLDSPAPPFSVCRSLSAAAGRRIERKRTRTGPKQPPVNRDRFPLSPPFVFRRASASSFLPSSPFPAVARKTLQCEMLSLRRTFRLALSPSPFVISLYLSRGCARAHFFPWFSLPLSLVAPPPQQLSARGSFQLVPAETFHRPPFSAFFPSGFFSPPRTFLARLISRLFFSERKSRVKIAGPYALNTATCDQYRMTCVTLSRDRLYRT